MVKKLVIILLVILFLVGVAVYFRVEFKYTMVQNGQSTLILNKLKKAVKQPTDGVHPAEVNIAAVAEESGIAFATDYSLYDRYIWKACQEECINTEGFYRGYTEVLKQLHKEELWVYQQNKTKDRVATYIFDKEKTVVLQILKKTRARVSDHYNEIKNNDMKVAAVNLIKLIDEKIASMDSK